MKINKLVIDHEYDFELIGIVSNLKEYKIAWHLNNILSISLSKQADLLIEFINNSRIQLSIFIHETQNGFIRLIRNKGWKNEKDQIGYLIPELKRYDYLLLLQRVEELVTIEQAITTLNTIPQILFVSSIEITTLKSKENLIF